MELTRRLRDLGSSAKATAAASGEWAVEAFSTLPAPDGAATERWKASVGALIAAQPKVPAGAGRPLRLLDRLGAVEFGPDGVGFDGTVVPWDQVRAVRSHDALDVLSGHVVRHEFDRLKNVMPPVPGRSWALRKAGGGFAALFRAVRGRVAQGRATRDVPWEIVHGDSSDEQRLTPCLYSTLFLAFRPDVTAALVATARAHGVRVADGPAAVDDRDDAERAAALDDLCRESDEAAAGLRKDGADREARGAAADGANGTADHVDDADAGDRPDDSGAERGTDGRAQGTDPRDHARGDR